MKTSGLTLKPFYQKLALLGLLGGLPCLSFGEISHSDQQEDRLLRVLSQIGNHKIDSALDDVQALITDNPNFKLAQLVYGDLLLARAQPLEAPGGPANSQSDAIEPLIDEARMRWHHHTSPHGTDKVPEMLVQIERNQKHVLVVDASQSRLFLFENQNNKPVLVDDFYASIGKNGTGKLEEGDKKTPVGVYFVSRYLEPSTLPDFYGHGAFPINYPNGWDRHMGRTGYGIWLHGNPLGTFSRPPQDSDGCVTVTNEDLDYLKSFIDVQKTPFIIAKQVEWRDSTEIQNSQQRFKQLLDQWVDDWESGNVEKYLSHYSRSFDAEGKDYKKWTSYKRAVNSNKSFINVELENISIFQYPGDDKVLVVTFEQDYKSDTHRSKTRKRLYWQQEEDGNWRIFYEGSV